MSIPNVQQRNVCNVQSVFFGCLFRSQFHFESNGKKLDLLLILNMNSFRQGKKSIEIILD